MAVRTDGGSYANLSRPSAQHGERWEAWASARLRRASTTLTLTLTLHPHPFTLALTQSQRDLTSSQLESRGMILKAFGSLPERWRVRSVKGQRSGHHSGWAWARVGSLPER